MAGIRIVHDSVRSKTLTLVDGKRPLVGAQSECPVCHRVHQFKTYHLNLDVVGATIVSVEIVDRLKRLPANGGFRIAEEIAKPPPQRIVLGGPLERRQIVAHPTLVEPV